MNDLRLPPPDKCRGLREANSALNHREYLDGVVELASCPRMLFLELTQACNLNCAYCRPAILSDRSLYMEDGLLRTTLAQLAPYVEWIDLRGWGESTLDQRLPELVRLCQGAGVKTQLYSNLMTHDDRYWHYLGEVLDHLAVSLDASDPELLARLRGRTDRRRVSGHLHAFMQGQQSRAGSGAHLSVVVSDANLAELAPLVRFAAEHGLGVVRLNPVTQAVPGHVYPSIGIQEPQREELRQGLLSAACAAQDVGVRLELGACLASEHGGGFDRCVHPWSYVVVSYNGDVLFCDHFVGNARAEMGRLASGVDFREVWNSRAYQDCRMSHKMHRFDRFRMQGLECDWCYTNRFVEAESRFEPSFVPVELRVSARSLVCDRRPAAMGKGHA